MRVAPAVAFPALKIVHFLTYIRDKHRKEIVFGPVRSKKNRRQRQGRSFVVRLWYKLAGEEAVKKSKLE